jgi:hypothetical protein
MQWKKEAFSWLDRSPNGGNSIRGDVMENSKRWNAISFLRPGWWLIHFVGISVVYLIGHFLLR